MNTFEEFTVLIGALAILFEGLDHLRSYLKKVFH
jgi:hypothetical protein